MLFRTITTSLILVASLLLSTAASAATTPVKIMCIGDSITQGPFKQPGQVAKQDSYRWSLSQKIKADGRSFRFIGRREHPFGGSSHYDFLHPTGWDYYHEGWAGRTSLDLIDEKGEHPTDWKPGSKRNLIFPTVASVSTKGVPDIVVLHIGTNDNNRSTLSGKDPVSGIAYKTLHTLASTKKNVVTLINNRLRLANPNVKILLAKIIPTRSNNLNNGIGCIGIKNINAAYEQVVREHSNSRSPIILVDQYTGYDPVKYNFDNFHPNTAGENVMAAKWHAALKPLLK